MHCGSRPSFERVDDITFRKPVEVGDLLRLKSLVLHTEVGGCLDRICRLIADDL